MSKVYKAIKEKVPTETVDVATAVAFIKEYARESFDETVELHIRLGVNPEKSDQMVRSQVTLPAGAPKQKKVVVIDDQNGEDLIKQIEKDGKLDADIVVATPSMMPKIAKVAKILGPQGLMPNPKTGTVSDDPQSVVKELEGGKLSFKMDQSGNIHEAIGKASWDADKLTANTQALIDATKAARPAAMKGQLIKSITLTSTMGPGIRLAVS